MLGLLQDLTVHHHAPQELALPEEPALGIRFSAAADVKPRSETAPEWKPKTSCSDAFCQAHLLVIALGSEAPVALHGQPEIGSGLHA